MHPFLAQKLFQHVKTTALLFFSQYVCWPHCLRIKGIEGQCVSKESGEAELDMQLLYTKPDLLRYLHCVTLSERTFLDSQLYCEIF